MNLTPKERVIAQIKHQETDYLPYTMFRFGTVSEHAKAYGTDVGERLDTYYGSSAWRNLVDSAIADINTHSLGVGLSTGLVYTDVYGCKWRIDRRPYHLEEPVLKVPSLRGYTFPNVNALFDAAWKQRTLQAIAQQKDHFVVVSFSFGLWERAWTLRGMESALMDMAGDPKFFEELLDRITEHQLEIIERLVELPVDGVFFSDDWGYQKGVLVGPQRWRRMFKPRLARMYARVHAAGKYTLSHCCGSVAEIMPDIIEIGLDVLESVQPEADKMNPYELKRRFGDGITFWGGLGSQSLVPFGKPEEIRVEVAKLCREMGKGGGYILAMAKAFQAETPTENAAAVIESFLQQAGVKFP